MRQATPEKMAKCKLSLSERTSSALSKPEVLIVSKGILYLFPLKFRQVEHHGIPWHSQWHL